LTAATAAFRQVMGREGTDGVEYPVEMSGRLEAGFSPEEVRQAADLAEAARAGEPQRPGA